MSFIIGANSAVAGGFDVDNSCNFEAGSLHKTVSSPSTTFTISVWVKLSNQYVATSSIGQRYFWTGGGAGGASGAKWNDGNAGVLDFYNEGTGHVDDGTDRNYRDPTAWYHWVWKNAGGTGTLYVNGVQNGSTFSMGPLIGSGGPAVINIGRYGADTVYAPMTMAEFVYLDGTGATPTSFGEFDEDSGVWKPIDVSGLTFGTNGFHLDFSNSSALGTDANGGTTLTKTATLSQLTDSPTNNFATWNPLVPSQGGYSSSTPTFTEGNLKFTTASATTSFSRANSTFLLTAGKWYTEVKVDNTVYGLIGVTGSNGTVASAYLGVYAYDYGWYGNAGFSSGDGNFYNNNTKVRELGNGFDDDDILGIALDLDSGTKTIQYYRAGSAVGSANTIVDPSTTDFGGYCISVSEWASSGNSIWQANFGNPSFSISSGNQDDNGYGNFEYAPPSGFLAMCTKNLSEVLS